MGAQIIADPDSVYVDRITDAAALRLCGANGSEVALIEVVATSALEGERQKNRHTRRNLIQVATATGAAREVESELLSAPECRRPLQAFLDTIADGRTEYRLVHVEDLPELIACARDLAAMTLQEAQSVQKAAA